jgi:DNA polymerase sigma
MKRSRFDTDRDARPVATQQQQQPQQRQQPSTQHIRWEVDKEAWPLNKQQQQPPQQQPSGSTAATWLDALKDEVLHFAQQALPDAQEQQQRQAAFNQFASAVNAVLGNRPGVAVQLFGSGRAGLALHCSDIDVMITGEPAFICP